MSLDAIERTTPFQRYVLLGVTALDLREETPVHDYHVREFCLSHVDDLADENPFEGGLSRESVIRALSKLEEMDLLTTTIEDESPVGKGRPAYLLAVDAEAVRESLAEDDLLGPVATSLDA